MAFLKKNYVNLLLCLGELAVGILLLVNPELFTRGIIMALGAAVAIFGIANIVRYFRTDPVEAAANHRLTFGLGQLALGLFCLTQSAWLVSLFPVLTRLYGTCVLVLALFRIEQFVDIRRLRLGKGLVSGISALITLLYAALILFIPEMTWIFIGVILLVEAVMDILILIFEKKLA